MKKTNVSIFVPHLGCPQRCSFCNQKIISGETRDVTADDVRSAIEAAIDSGCDPSSEIAFFGGSFTAIGKDQMTVLLKSAYPYVESGRFSGIRISTRPDAVSEEILQILKKYGVSSIELGAQSMDDTVLEANLRGHTADDVRKASGLIKNNGFSLGLQMMTGLYGSSRQTDVFTFKELMKLSPDTLRIYPAITLKGTYLAKLYEDKSYIPPSLDETVSLCAELISMLKGTKTRLIRLGLHAEDGVERDRVAGPYHPAFGQLCRSKLMFDEAAGRIKKGKTNFLHVNPRSLSTMQGQKKRNLTEFSKLGYDVKIVADENVPLGELEVKY
ncbi:MAG: elongator complex protein 3 [Acutalibacteraceae bacterium]